MCACRSAAGSASTSSQASIGIAPPSIDSAGCRRGLLLFRGNPPNNKTNHAPECTRNFVPEQLRRETGVIDKSDANCGKEKCTSKASNPLTDGSYRQRTFK